MAKIFEHIDDKLTAFIEAQHMFFVATAPLAADGHVNLSPKGLNSFRILGPNRVGYLDLTGSGAETIAHLKENGRICFMFCAFEGAARILRLHGTGQVAELGTPAFDEAVKEFTPLPGARAVITANITRIADSCGWAVPFYHFEGDRDQYRRYAENSPPEKLAADRRKDNTASIDGLPAFGRG